MANVYYAWTDIRSGTADKPILIKAGAKVDKAALGVDDDQWAQLVDSRSVRTAEYPKMPDTWQDSPVNYLLKQAKDAADTVTAEATNSAEATAAAQAAVEAQSGQALTTDEG